MKIIYTLALIFIYLYSISATKERLFSSFKSSLVNCKYSCSNQATPQQNPNYTPVPNGCGSFGLSLDKLLKNFDKVIECCNQHDICYGLCNKAKSECDSQFNSCLMTACSSYKLSKFLACDAGRKAATAAVEKLGCSAYLSNQKESCLC